ncbi:Uncharacterized conserved protein, DUF2147 family [Acinetobacter marinus]|uniref:Uncharacterized conserved protein, DUF2147 family n=2 Tax=Acinetobacter marinus TaxID=281375 RepID=A0A1G6GUY1_9GAMM|nr:DUF2147 domain-containing protein [Acinetobacter marinus]SDB85751.1 Uncharacterized conserved protein, DUF2147 family [Acinetobacter marinus]
MKKVIQGFVISSILAVSSLSAFAASPIVGYWKSMDDRTGEPLSIVQIEQEKNGTYSGTIVYRYANQGGHTLTTCAKCPEPYKDKPLVGLKILTGFTELAKKPGYYVNGKVVDAKSGGVYKGKANVSKNGKRLNMRGYVGVSLLGRSNVWVRHDSANP